MTLSKRERLAAIGLLVALCALAVDRLLLPGPTQAAAGESAPPRPDVVKLSPALAAPPQAPEDRAPATDPARPVPDVFDLARITEVSDSPNLAAAAQSDTLARAEAFAGSHTLSGTVLGPRPLALVGQQTIELGRDLDGFTLESVTATDATFISDGQRVVLRVRGPARPR